MAAITPDRILDNDLNKTIAAAVNAKVEAGVLAALSGDDVIGRFVTAALSEAIKAATAAACKRLVAEEMPAIEAAVLKELRKRLPGIAKDVAETVGKSMTGYGLKIEFTHPNRG